MGYASAVKAAGAEIKAFEQFGSYQGDWWMLVVYQGKIGFITGAYGSCSQCDAYAQEMGYREDDVSPEQWDARERAFGARYLEAILPLEEAIRRASVNIEWDMDAEEMVAWIRRMGALFCRPPQREMERPGRGAVMSEALDATHTSIGCRCPSCFQPPSRQPRRLMIE